MIALQEAKWGRVGGRKNASNDNWYILKFILYQKHWAKHFIIHIFILGFQVHTIGLIITLYSWHALSTGPLFIYLVPFHNVISTYKLTTQNKN